MQANFMRVPSKILRRALGGNGNHVLASSLILPKAHTYLPFIEKYNGALDCVKIVKNEARPSSFI